MIDWNKTFNETGFDKNYFIKFPKSNKFVYRICDQCSKWKWVRFWCCGDLCIICSTTKHNKNGIGKKHTKEHNAKITKSLIGNKRSLGYKHTLETRIFNSCLSQGIDIKDFNGFSKNKDQPHLTPINQCIQLNKKFVGSNGHHITTNVVVFLPKDLHKSISHNMKTGKNMIEINKLALNYLITNI